MFDIIRHTQDLHRFEKEEVVDRLLQKDPSLMRDKIDMFVGEALLLGCIFEIFEHNLDTGTFSLTDKTFEVLKHFKVI